MNILKRLFGKRPTKNADGPIERFEKEISAWPVDEAKTALLVLKASIEGDQATIDSLFGDLRVGQAEAVRKTLEEIENASE